MVQAASELFKLDNEKEAYGRTARMRGEYDRVPIPMMEIWPNFMASPPGRLIHLLDIARFAPETQAAETGALMQAFLQRRDV